MQRSTAYTYTHTSTPSNMVRSGGGPVGTDHHSLARPPTRPPPTRPQPQSPRRPPRLRPIHSHSLHQQHQHQHQHQQPTTTSGECHPKQGTKGGGLGSRGEGACPPSFMRTKYQLSCSRALSRIGDIRHSTFDGTAARPWDGRYSGGETGGGGAASRRSPKSIVAHYTLLFF